MDLQNISRELFICAAKSSYSEHKRLHLINLPKLIPALAQSIHDCTWRPKQLTVFAVTDPKLREIFAPAYEDRLVQHWLVMHIEPWFDSRFIDDSFANRKTKGVFAAIQRLQHFMHKPQHRYYLKLDIRAFFPSIDRGVLLDLWDRALPKMQFDEQTKHQINHVATAIITQSPIHPPPIISGDLRLLHQIPANKSLFNKPPHTGLPIGSLTSQFFANVYLNELDQFVKQQRKVFGYLRYVDDFVLLARSRTELVAHQIAIETFVREKLHLEIHPHKIVLQRVNQGIHFLGAIVHKHHRLSRQRTVRALKKRLDNFKRLILSSSAPRGYRSDIFSGTWARWLRDNTAFDELTHEPTPALLQRMLATINSYYGVLKHANTYTLRKNIFHKHLGELEKYFAPIDSSYSHLGIQEPWKH